ncbi:MAG TPA: sigma-70 family RNA polymerase sigma factor [Thermomicrobiales bacterium]|nr:sigma-70 family RNA polymerase sigma factor [Thermomicrobiales bacterium]
MPESPSLAERFESHRPHLLAVATRLLGSPTEAEDAVQETWLRLERAGDDGIENLGAWLTTVVSRICLDHLRSRSSRREDPVDPDLPEPGDDAPGPEDVAILTESTAEAVAIVLDTLAPTERVAFVLHDVFDVPFADIAPIVDRTPTATRQMASRARRRVRAQRDTNPFEPGKHQHAVEAFLRASRAGDLQGLLAVLHPDVVLRADETALRMGARSGWLTADLQGATAVADQFNGRAQAARLATIDGQLGAVWASGERPVVVFRFTVDRDAVAGIELIADRETIASLDIRILTD